MTDWLGRPPPAGWLERWLTRLVLSLALRRHRRHHRHKRVGLVPTSVSVRVQQ